MQCQVILTKNMVTDTFEKAKKPVIEENVTLHTKCNCCKQFYSLTVNSKRLIDWLKSGETDLVQNVFPEISADDRELFFISNICGDCFDKLFEE